MDAVLRPLALALALSAVSSAPSIGALQPSEADARLVRVEQWLKAVRHHEPGTTDQAAALVASWYTRDIRMLWIDANVITQAMRDPRKSRFSFRAEGQSTTQSIQYSSQQLRRLKVLACAAAGILAHPVCVEVGASTALDADLLGLAGLASASRQQGDDNFVLRRGALLHTDIAMLMPTSAEPIGPTGLGGPQRIRVQTTDGLALDMGQTAPHWDLARMLLDYVKPPGAASPAPGLDDMVRLWYRATSAWMQAREQHDTAHLDRARAIFPNDADILFLSACQHEAYAGPLIQSALQSTVMPTSLRWDVASARSELHQAESFFRRALAARPGMTEAHLRYGRVLSLLERHADAVTELRQAMASTDDSQLRYYGELFLGAVETARRDVGAARDAYARAAQLYPTAQSPRIALSELARRRGDRGGALREMQVVFDRPATDSEPDDPWWRYFVVQAQNAADLLDELRRPFKTEALR